MDAKKVLFVGQNGRVGMRVKYKIGLASNTTDRATNTSCKGELE
jgi:hypothetical protein